MALPFPATEQDTIKFTPVNAKESITVRNDSLHHLSRKPKTVITPADTTLFCTRNSIADITFSDSASFIRDLQVPGCDNALLIQAEKAAMRQAEMKNLLISSLRDGREMPAVKLHDDWLIVVIVAIALLYSLIRTTSRGIQPLLRFFFMRGITDHDSREPGGMFFWQTTILNLISFSVISAFCYDAAVYYGLLPLAFPGFIFWLICFGIIVIAITLRHAVCVLTGNLSGQREAFNEYLAGVYQSYHFSALILFIIVILLSYTAFLPAGALIITGTGAFALLYLFRVARLLIIFMNRNISVFYLILYLCALEILPAAIAIRYFAGLG